MKDNANAVELEGNNGVLYYPYLEPKHGEQAGLLESLSQKACAVVTDDFPCFLGIFGVQHLMEVLVSI